TGTDRLWVSWLLDSQRVKQRLAGTAQVKSPDALLESLTPLVRMNEDGSPQRGGLAQGLTREYALIEVPGNIVALQQRDPELGVEWREATREAFTSAIGAGFLVEEFHRRKDSGQVGGVYLLRASRTLADIS